MKHYLIAILGVISISGCNSSHESTVDRAALTGKTWQLELYGYPGSSKSQLISNTRYTLAFDIQTDVVTGSIDCNGFRSSYEINSNKISIEAIAPTEKGCQSMTAADYSEQNSFILSTLASLDSYTVGNNALVLTSVDGAELYYFVEN